MWKNFLYKNDEIVEKDRIVFSRFEEDNSTTYNSYYVFSAKGDNDLEKAFGGYVKSDTLILTGFYFFFDESKNCNGCCTYLNYFIRE